MIWQDLFTNRRMGDDQSKPKSANGRSSFLKDYDRILFSAPFRKLQNKTQVFPLPDDIFVHNRLTHSLEVAAVGRSLGSIVGEKLCELYSASFDENTKQFYLNELSNVISAACLSHDIGNPPFGHAGEVAISEFFLKLRNKNLDSLNQLSQQEWADLCHFEGNANGFRILVQNRGQDIDAYRLTLTTLASMIKYPTSSTYGNQKKSPFISNKKYGFFSSEKDAFEEVINHFNLPALEQEKNIFARHPFVYLVEAADDICYLIIDLEDAHNLGLVEFDKCFELLSPFFKNGEGFWTIKNIKNKLDSISGKSDKMSYLRAVTINTLVSKCADIFIEKEQDLLNGQLNMALMNYLSLDDLEAFNNLKKFSFLEIYSHQQVAEKELTGYNVIENLLKEFSGLILHPEHPKSKLIKKILPESCNFWDIKDISTYNQFRIILDYISSLSDFQAVKLHQKINIQS